MTSPASTIAVENPYPGLRPFDEQDVNLFFGRRDQTYELLRRLEERRFVAVVGLSGSGKSSLVRAGLIPALRQGYLTEGGKQWRIAEMRPGADPVHQLSEALDEALGKNEARQETLRRSSFGLIRAARVGRSPDENLLVLVDQFEEIFRQPKESSRDFVHLLLTALQEAGADYRIYIVLTMRTDYLGDCAQFRDLPEALNDSQYLVPRLTLDQRREAIEQPAKRAGVEVDPLLLQQLLLDAGDEPDQLPILQHRLMRMWDLSQAPAHGVSGSAHEPSIASQTPAHEVSGSTLTSSIPSREAAHEVSGYIPLPQRHRDPDDTKTTLPSLTLREYNTAGEWQDAISQHGRELMEPLSEAQRKIAQRIFQRVTELGGRERDRRRLTRLSELVAVCETLGTEDDVRDVIQHFTRANFLTSPDWDSQPDPLIDITHESLIRQWTLLNVWARLESHSGEWYRRVEDRVRTKGNFLKGEELKTALDAREKGAWTSAWAARYADLEKSSIPFDEVTSFLDASHKEQEEERRRISRRRKAVSAAAVVFAVLAAAAGYFWWSARIKQHEARSRELAAYAVESLGEDPERSITLAVQAVNATLRFGQAVVPVAANTLHRAIISSNVRRTLRGRTADVLSVAFSPDGKYLATESDDRTVQMHVLDLQLLLDLAKQRVTREFTPEECQHYFSGEACPAFHKAAAPN